MAKSSKNETSSTTSTAPATNGMIEDQKSESDGGGDLSGEAAGVVRGVSRTVGRTAEGVLRTAPIGRLPRPSASMMRQRLPVRQVARVSDRVSTGMEWWASATEGVEPHKKFDYWKRVQGITFSLAKNTILGIAVFECYGSVVSRLAPPPLTTFVVPNKSSTEEAASENDDFDDDYSIGESLTLDDYDRAPTLAHVFAGGLAGSVHGVLSSVVERAQRSLRCMALNTMHHSVAHALLFGSYEGIKRQLLRTVHEVDEETAYYGPAYLSTFCIAGGIAGQVQHIASHYLEHGLGIVDGTLSPQFNKVPSLPIVRPVLYAFPPSAIGFVAFEYGKKFMT